MGHAPVPANKLVRPGRAVDRSGLIRLPPTGEPVSPSENDMKRILDLFTGQTQGNLRKLLVGVGLMAAVRFSVWRDSWTFIPCSMGSRQGKLDEGNAYGTTIPQCRH